MTGCRSVWPSEMSREESLRRTNQEIVREQAEALGRAGEQVERLLWELATLASELQGMEGVACPEAVAQTERRYAALRARALEARQRLMIQREAVGFRRHALVTELFAVPPSRTPGARGGRSAGTPPVPSRSER